MLIFFAIAIYAVLHQFIYLLMRLYAGIDGWISVDYIFICEF